MKRLALVLAAAVLGTGCIWVDDDDCDRSVTLEWDFQTANGTVVGCNGATVDAGVNVPVVDVFVNDQFAGRFDCFAGRGTIALPEGSSLVTVEGVDAENFPAYREEFSVDGRACGNQLVVTRPAEGRINLDYGISPASSAPPCAGGPCFVWFSVWDDIVGQVAATINAGTQPTRFPYPNDLVFRLPVGPYTVQFVDVVSGGFAERLSCTTPTFTVSPGAFVGEEQLVPASGPVLLQASCL